MGNKKRRKKSSPVPESEPSWWERQKKHSKILIGLGIIALGMQLMSYSAIIGTLTVYVGLVVCVCEVVCERWFIEHDPRIQLAAIGAIAIFCTWFTITTFPVSRMAIEIALSPARRTAKVSELHVLIRNGNDSEYQPLNVMIKPNSWIGKAGILSKPSGCELDRIMERTLRVMVPAKNGNNSLNYSNVLGDLRITNENGIDYYEVATKSTFRLHCISLPPGFTVHLTFDVVAFVPQLNSVTTSAPNPGSLDIADIVNPSGALGDIFDNASCMVNGEITGNYKFKLWTHWLSQPFNVNECK